MRNLSIEEAFTLNEAVSSLADHPGWRAVTRLLDEEVGSIDNDLDLPQKPLEHTEYALLHGRRGGLRGAREALEAIVERTESVIEGQRAIHEAGSEPVGV